MTTVLIDGDILIYKIPEDYTGTFVMESVNEDDDSIYRTIDWGSKEGTKQFLKEKIENIKEVTKSKNAIICLSSPINFRKQLNPDYKIKRRAIKPVLYEFVKTLFKNEYNAIERENLEADDLIGILATYEGKIKNVPQDRKVIWSLDKDFKTIPCTFYREDKDGIVEKYMTDEKTADYNFMFQTLTGDTVDCYSGCKGIGAKTAQKILDDTDKTLKNMWKKVVETYIDKGQTFEDALLNARCARILRAQDYNFKTKEIKLWQITT